MIKNNPEKEKRKVVKMLIRLKRPSFVKREKVREIDRERGRERE